MILCKANQANPYSSIFIFFSKKNIIEASGLLQVIKALKLNVQWLHKPHRVRLVS